MASTGVPGLFLVQLQNVFVSPKMANIIYREQEINAFNKNFTHVTYAQNKINAYPGIKENSAALQFQ